MIKGVLWVLAALPAAWLLADFLLDRLSANPIEDILHRLGWWGLALLVLSLAISPARRLFGWNRLIRYRRFVGLWAFAYITAHFLSYLVLDQFFAWEYILEDLVERPFILSGFVGWLLLVPLAATSTKGWIRRLGKRWTKLHRLVYVAALAGVLHFYWRVKADTAAQEPLLFALVLTLLLIVRVPLVRDRIDAWRRGRRAAETQKNAAGPKTRRAREVESGP